MQMLNQSQVLATFNRLSDLLDKATDPNHTPLLDDPMDLTVDELSDHMLLAATELLRLILADRLGVHGSVG